MLVMFNVCFWRCLSFDVVFVVIIDVGNVNVCFWRCLSFDVVFVVVVDVGNVQRVLLEVS